MIEQEDILNGKETLQAKPISFDLKERARIIADFDRKTEYYFNLIHHYEEDIKFVLDHKLDVSIILRMTMNLALFTGYFCSSLTNYGYVTVSYLIDDRYEKNRDYWSKFIDAREKLQILFDRLQENNIFEVEKPNEKKVIERLFYDNEYPLSAVIYNKLNTNEVERSNGAELMICINHQLQFIEENLNFVKVSYIQLNDKYLKIIYDSNYLLFEKKYWPEIKSGFRSHITIQRLKDNVSVSGLEKLRDEVMHEFEYHTDTGKKWRDYSENIPQLVLQLKDQKIDEEQWKHFFKTIFEIKEIDRWIEELKNPPESEEDKQKRVRLLASSNIFNLKPSNQHKEVDILLLYQFIDNRFIEDEAVMHTYDWFALYYVLMKNDLIATCSIEDFARQMNDKEWFEDAERKCSAKEIKKYSFLLDIEPQKWSEEFDKSPYHISKNSIFSIYSKWYMMNDIMDEVIERKHLSYDSDKTIIVNGNYYDIHNNNTVNL